MNRCPVEQELIEANHSSAYLTRARQTCAGGSTFLDSLDVTVSEESYDIALKAAGATLALAEGVINREIQWLCPGAPARPPCRE